MTEVTPSRAGLADKTLGAHGLPAMEAPARGQDSAGETPRPPYDPSVGVISPLLSTEPLMAEDIVAARQPWLTADVLVQMHGVTHRDVTCPGFGGEDITLAVFRRPDDDEVGPGFVWIHGGGMVTGDRFGVEVLPHLLVHGGTVVSIEYRLAPEHPAPTPVEDCYLGLTWAVAHAAELGFDPARVILAGGSAGGGLAAGTALLARDRGTPALAGVLLHCPMLDDRNDSLSIRQYDRGPGWSGRSNEVGWAALLGAARGTSGVSPYDAPARARWLGGLPAVHLAVGSADAFRSENVAFAEGIWRDGGDCELYVVPGGHHGYELMVPDASISTITEESRRRWVNRILNPDDTSSAMVRLQQIAAAMGRQV